MDNRIVINEVGPRDGFQNVDEFIDTRVKLAIIDGLVAAGLQRIQITSFVSPKAVPQMRDAQEVARSCLARYPGVSFYALVPNLKGAEIAESCGISEVSYVASVSESHNLANVKRSVTQSIEELGTILARHPKLKVILDVATAFGCPVEGEISDDQVSRYIDKAAGVGVTRFTLCDTVGVANPRLVRERVGRLIRDYPDFEFRVHIHDTRNMGMVNTLTAVECGVRDVEVAIGGLGGCPFAQGASGNTSTEDFVYMANAMGYETGIDFDKLLATAKYAQAHINGNFSGHQIMITRDCKVQ